MLVGWWMGGWDKQRGKVGLIVAPRDQTPWRQEIFQVLAVGGIDRPPAGGFIPVGETIRSSRQFRFGSAAIVT